MKKSELIAAIQKEILRHDFGTFVDNPPSVAQGGRDAPQFFSFSTSIAACLSPVKALGG